MIYLKKEMNEARTLLRNANRGMNEIIATMRHIDYTDTSKDNMLVIDGLVRSLAYMNACKNQGLYFVYILPKLVLLQKKQQRKLEKDIRKLKAMTHDITDEEIDGFFSGFMENITSELGLEDEMEYEEFSQTGTRIHPFFYDASDGSIITEPLTDEEE